MSWPIIALAIEIEADIVVVRQRARKLAELLEFERQDQTRIATAVSEIARNAYGYAGRGRAEFALLDTTPVQRLWIRITDRGRGIPDLDSVLEGRHRSSNGMGLGITGARRLLDHFEIRSDTMGTCVELGQDRPARAGRITLQALQKIVTTLRQHRDDAPLSALREQNSDLLQSLTDIRRRRDETEQLNRELADTNRGVVALYAELDERAEQLRQASEVKSRFLSNMILEFRQDTGIGIAAKDHERIFEEFSQVEGRLQVKGSGTGLGLPLVSRASNVAAARTCWWQTLRYRNATVARSRARFVKNFRSCPSSSPAATPTLQPWKLQWAKHRCCANPSGQASSPSRFARC
jgi:anti-sigma regulatory factor (Ser/Thr protein kinase)